jgi:MYXO-CTERM domain-containing protein
VPRTAACALALGTTACDDIILTEHHQVSVAAELSMNPFFSGDPVLVDTQICMRLDRYRVTEGIDGEWADADDSEIRACYRESLHGSARIDEAGCLSFDAPGDVVWEIERRPCDLDGTFGDDHVRFDVVDITEVRGAFDEAIPLHPEASAWFTIEDPALDQPGVLATEGEPLRIIEDLAEGVYASVVTGEAPREVAVQDTLLRGTAVAGTPVIDNEHAQESSLGFAASAGDVFSVAIDLPAGTLKVGEVHIVGRDAIASIELHPYAHYVRDTDELWGGPGATAIARDSERRVLREPPISWSVVRGEFTINPIDADDDGRPGPSPWVSIDDPCAGARRGEERTATLQGTLDDFTGTVDVSWRCADGIDEGCACAASPGRTPAIASLLALLALARRRRTVHAPRAAAEAALASARSSAKASANAATASQSV